MHASFPSFRASGCQAGNLRRASAWLACPALALFWGGALLAQTLLPPTVSAPAAPADEAVELSPFVVNAETDKGYVATSTLVGGRTKMELRDVAAQVSVFTTEFMRDVGATNLEEMLLYSGNVESALEFNTAGGAGFGVFRNTPPIRGRGLAGVSMTRNGYPTLFDSDNYNVDRVSLIGGPNALLFGMGSPAGISDSGLNRAQLTRLKGSLGLRLDGEGSKRVSFDLNQPLVSDRLALRFDGVRDRREYWLKPSEYRNDRFYTALTAKPTRTTTLNVNSEWADVSIQRAVTQVPSDGVSLWLDRGAVPYDNSPTRAVGNANPLYRNASKPLFVYGNVGTPGVVNFVNTAATRSYYDSVTFPSTPTADANVAPPLTRAGIIPDDVNWFGLGRATNWSGSSQIATLEQRVGRDFFAEFAFQQETVTTREGGLFAGNANGVSAPSYTINVDPNRYLPDGLTPNPNLGKYYVEGNGGAGYSRDDADELRLTLSYDLRLADRRDVWRWLGTHRFMAMGSVRDQDTLSQGNEALVAGTPSFITGAAVTNLGAAGRRFTGRYYLDQLGQGGRFGPEMIQNTVFGPWTFVDPATGRDFRVYTYDNPAGSNQVPTLNRQRILSRALADTATLWQGRLVLLAGWREDRTQSKGALAADTTANSANGMYLPVSRVRYNTIWENYSAGQSMSYGGVFHPWKSKWLSLHYNRSSNYSAPGGFYDVNDRLIPGSTGTGDDFGARVELGEGRFTARLSFFRNSQVGWAKTGDMHTVVRNAYDIEQQMELLNPTMPKFGLNASRARGAYGGTVDFDAKGLDLDVTANPTKNWRIFGTVGRQKTVNANADASLEAWLNARLPVWKSYPSWATDLMPTGNTLISESYQTTVYNAYYFGLVQRNGNSVENQREWRGNLVSNYSFSSGRLKGWTVGGGARYRSAATIGYALQTVTLPGGKTAFVIDGNKPYRTSEELTWDALVRYQLKLAGRMSARVQLNVRNLLDENLRVPSAAYTDGAISRYSRQEPRTIMLETTVEF